MGEPAHPHAVTSLQGAELEALNAIIWTVSESLDRDEVLHRVLRRVLDVLPAEAGEIFLLDEGSQRLTRVAYEGESPEAFAERTEFALGEGVIGSAAESNRAMFWDYGAQTAVLRPAIAAAGFARFAAIPLLARGRTWGVMGVATRLADGLREGKRAFLEAAGRQVGLAVAIAEAYSHQRVLSDRLEAVNRAASIITTAHSVDEVLREIVEHARSLTGARYGAIGVHHPDGFLRKFISSGVSEAEIAAIGNPPIGRGLLGALREEAVIRVDDISADRRFRGFPPKHPLMHSFLGVSVRDSDRILGRIYLADKEGSPTFTDEDAASVVSLARHAAVAIANATLYENLSRQTRYLEAIYEVGKRITASLSFDGVMEAVIDGAVATLGADAAFVYVVEAGLPMLRCVAARGFTETNPKGVLVGRTEGVLGRVSLDGFPVFVGDLEQDPDRLKLRLYGEGFHSVLLSPIRGRAGPYGVLGVAYRHVETPTVSAQQAVYALSDLAGVAIENAQALEQARAVAVFEDRERIAMDLHDTTLQEVFAAGLRIEFAADRIEEDPREARELLSGVMERLEGLNRSIRSYIGQLSGGAIEQSARIDVVIENAARQIDATLGSTTIIEVEPAEYPEVETGAVEQLLLVAREAVANAHKHAHAERVVLSLSSQGAGLRLTVEDNGSGFDPLAGGRAGHYGLHNMAERARKIGAQLSITSEPGKGTLVTIDLPTTEVPGYSKAWRTASNN